MIEKHQYLHEIAQHDSLNDENRSCLLVMRHSIRNNFSDGSFQTNMQTLLNDDGKRLAVEFGKLLPRDKRNYYFYHSPVPRCEETAQLISQQVPNVTWQGVLPILGAEFVHDFKKVMGSIVELGLVESVTMWLENKVDPDLIDPIGKAATDIFNGIMNTYDQHDQPAVYVYVTHDLTIMTLLYYVFKNKILDFGIPRFLEGVILLPDNDKVDWYYRNSYLISHHP